MRKPQKLNLTSIPVETAHGGSGSRQVLFSGMPPQAFQAWTKGFLPAGAAYDWHQHDKVDEYFIVLQGTGTVEYADGTTWPYAIDDIFMNPANLDHRITNTGDQESIFYFFRTAI